MANTQQNDIQNAKIQGLLARYLELRSKQTPPTELLSHLDEDTLNAFTEGRILERDAVPVISHLSDCGFCRHRTVELVRLDMHFSDLDEAVPFQDPASEPVSVSSVLSGILSRIFGTSEAAVFAHEEPKEETEDETADDDESSEK